MVDILDKLDAYLLEANKKVEILYFNEFMPYKDIKNIQKDIVKEISDNKEKQNILRKIKPVFDLFNEAKKLEYFNEKKTTVDIDFSKEERGGYVLDVNFYISFDVPTKEVEEYIKDAELDLDDPSVGIYASLDPYSDALDLIIDNTNDDVISLAKKTLRNIKYDINQEDIKRNTYEYVFNISFSMRF